MKNPFVTAIAVALFVFAVSASPDAAARSSQAGAAKPKPAAAKSAAAKKAPTKKRSGRAHPLRSTADLGNTSSPAPAADGGEISQAVVDALSTGNMSAAILVMRDEPDSPKLFSLIRAATRIVTFDMNQKVEKTEVHQTFQNIGIAYHNLYLFLKSKGIEQKEFYREALRLYRKGKGAGTPMHKADCQLLEAALLAAGGEREKAARLFAKIDDAQTRGDFESMEYLAAYYAAAGNVEGAIAAMDAAHRLNPDATLTWLAVGDDFTAIADDPQFKALLVTWKAREAGKKLRLSLPKGEKPKLEVTDQTNIFHPQKSMPHYDLKKASGSKQKADLNKKQKKTKTSKHDKKKKTASKPKNISKKGKSR